MKLQEGPLFGALIIGAGVGFLLYQRNGDLSIAILAAVVLTVLGYGVEVLVRKFFGK